MAPSIIDVPGSWTGRCRKSRWWQRWTQEQSWRDQGVPHSADPHRQGPVIGSDMAKPRPGLNWLFPWHPCVHFLTGPDAAQVQVKLRETQAKATGERQLRQDWLYVFFLSMNQALNPYWPLDSWNTFVTACKIAQEIKACAAKPQDLSSIPECYMVEIELWFLQAILWPPHVHCDPCVRPPPIDR